MGRGERFAGSFTFLNPSFPPKRFHINRDERGDSSSRKGKRSTPRV